MILSNLAMDEGRRVYFNEIDKMGRGEERAGKGAANGLAIGVKISRKARDCRTWRSHSWPMPLSFRGTEHPAWIVLLPIIFFARRDDSLGSHPVEQGDARAVHGEDGSDSESAV